MDKNISPQIPDAGFICPIFRSDLKMSVARRDGQIVHLIEDPVSGKVFQIGVQESSFFLAMDGKLSLADYAADPESELDADQALKLFQWGHAKALWLDQGDAAIERDRNEFKRESKQRITRWLNPISIQVSLGCPADWLQRLGTRFQWLFSGWMVTLWCVLCLISVAMLYANGSRFSSTAGQAIADGGWIIMLATWLIAKVFHESAHGIACYRYGVRVRDCGMILVLLMPLAYVDVSGCNRLPSRWQRIVVSAAGVYLELFLTFIAMILWCVIEDRTIATWLQAWIVTSGLTTILFNANPLMKYDGYYVLSDWLDISNLATRGRGLFWGSVARICLGVTPEASQLTGWRRNLVWAYGLLAIIWRLLLTLTLVLAATAMFHGAGILIALAAGAYMVIAPVVLLFHKWKLGAFAGWKTVNVASSGTIAIVVLLLTFQVLSGPVWLSAPAVVEEGLLANVRSESNGFVENVLVEHGQQVKQGDALVVLRNDELVRAVADLELRLRQADIRFRMNRQSNNFADASADQKEIESLKQTLLDKRSELENRTIRATCAGQINLPDAQRLTGTYVRQGQVVLKIDNEEKQIAVSVAQDSLPSVQRNYDRPVQVLLTGFPTFEGHFSNLIPNADLQLPSPSLASTNGGPLSVRPVEEGKQKQGQFHNGNDPSRVELFEPRFVAKVKLVEKSQSVPVGQTGWVYFRSVKQSLGAYTYVSVKQWFESHLPRVL